MTEFVKVFDKTKNAWVILNKLVDVQEVKGEKGEDGTNGVTFIPNVSSSGDLSWSNDGGLNNPSTVNIKGPKGNTGDTGESGVYYGTTEPADKDLLWVQEVDQTNELSFVLAKNINRIELVAEYPSVMEENVLYLRYEEL